MWIDDSEQGQNPPGPIRKKRQADVSWERRQESEKPSSSRSHGMTTSDESLKVLTKHVETSRRSMRKQPKTLKIPLASPQTVTSQKEQPREGKRSTEEGLQIAMSGSLNPDPEHDLHCPELGRTTASADQRSGAGMLGKLEA
jgi:hypothetical protein